MQDTKAAWSQRDATEYEATQELLTKVMAACIHGLSKKDLTTKDTEPLRAVLNDVQSAKKGIQPTSRELHEIRAKYRDILLSIHNYACE